MLAAVLTGVPGGPRRLRLPINVDDPTDTHFEPDLTVVRKEFALIENGDLPLLAVEVCSSSTASRDAVLKRREYARLGKPPTCTRSADTTTRSRNAAGPSHGPSTASASGRPLGRRYRSTPGEQ